MRSVVRKVEGRVLDVYGPNGSHRLLAVPLHASEGEVLAEETVGMQIRQVIRRPTVA